MTQTLYVEVRPIAPQVFEKLSGRFVAFTERTIVAFAGISVTVAHKKVHCVAQ